MLQVLGAVAPYQPKEMGADEVTAFLTSLAVQSRVAASTQNQALSAPLFLYRDVLGTQLRGFLGAPDKIAAQGPATR